MDGEKDDLSTHLEWFRNRNRKNFVKGYRNDEENALPFSSSSLSVTSLASTWLQTTLFDLDKKTQILLELIEEDDADSFAKRAEMYYKRRPQLIHMVQEFHRAHRSLAERYQQLVMNKKTPSYYDPLPSTSTITSSSSSSEEDDIKSYPDSINISTSTSSFCCSFSGDTDSLSSDPDEDPSQLKQEPEAASVAASDSTNVDHAEEMIVRREEMESLVEENKKLKEQLMQKDEEKREVIRQLCFSLEFLRSENEDLMEMMMMRKNAYDRITPNNELNVLG